MKERRPSRPKLKWHMAALIKCKCSLSSDLKWLRKISISTISRLLGRSDLRLPKHLASKLMSSTWALKIPWLTQMKRMTKFFVNMASFRALLLLRTLHTTLIFILRRWFLRSRRTMTSSSLFWLKIANLTLSRLHGTCFRSFLSMRSFIKRSRIYLECNLWTIISKSGNNFSTPSLSTSFSIHSRL